MSTVDRVLLMAAVISVVVGLAGSARAQTAAPEQFINYAIRKLSTVVVACRAEFASGITVSGRKLGPACIRLAAMTEVAIGAASTKPVFDDAERRGSVPCSTGRRHDDGTCRYN